MVGRVTVHMSPHMHTVGHSCKDSETAGTAGTAALNANPDLCRDETSFRKVYFKMFFPRHSKVQLLTEKTSANILY